MRQQVQRTPKQPQRFSGTAGPLGGMVGRLSCSAAILDDGAGGLVLTSIDGRALARSYLKGVKSGTSEATLSPEEQQAVSFALRGAQS